MRFCRVNSHKAITQDTSKITIQLRADQSSNIYSLEDRIKLNNFKKAKENMKLATTKLDW